MESGSSPKENVMKKSLRILALLLALVLLCGCQDPAASTPATTVPSGPADYTVSVVDPLGNGVENVGVKFLKNGEQVGMAITGADGKVTKELERGDYTLQLTFLDVEHAYYYNAEEAKLTASKTEVAVTVAYEVGTDAMHLSISGGERPAYTLVIAGSSITITGITDKSLDGTYTFKTTENGLQVENPVIDIQKGLFKKYIFQTATTNAPQNIVDAQGNEVKELVDGTYTVLSNEYDAYRVEAGCTYVKLNEAGQHYFVFTPARAGVYAFSLMGDGTIGSHGTPNFAYASSDAELEGNQFRKTITQDMIGTNGTGTTQLVIGIDAEQAGETYLCIQWVADPPKVVEWENYNSTYTPSKYTLPTGAVLQDFDLTADTYKLVYNEEDQFYHLNTADGPLVLIRLLPAEGYEGFVLGNVLLGANIGIMVYDENGEVVQKIMYNNCVQQYLGTISGTGASAKFVNGMCDDTQGVYPLTKDLALVMKAYGEFMGYWDADNLNYMFADMDGLNVDNAWLFICCYLQ